jgi:hypothetical protein
LLTPLHNFVFDGMLRGIMFGCGKGTIQKPIKL